MPHYGLLEGYRFEDVDDVRDSEVYGVNNEKLGTVEDMIFDHSTGEIRYVVVATGEWLNNRKVLVPIDRIQPYGSHEDKFYAELDKERMRMLPEFNRDTLRSTALWNEYEKSYQDQWNHGAVMYNKETGRIVTPPIDQVQGGRTTPLSEEDKRSLERDFTPQKLGTEDDLLGVASSGDDITLRPQKASIADEDILVEQGVADAEKARTESSAENTKVPDPATLQEPGVYVLDRVPAEGKTPYPDKAAKASHGRRWTAFQQKLREGRDEVVRNCPV